MTTKSLLVFMWLGAASGFGIFSSVQRKLGTNYHSGCNNIDNGDCDNMTPNIFAKTPEVISKYGYPVETHTVTTEDGYLLTVHRIPGSPKAGASGAKGPVLVQHGILAASDFWTTTGPDNALGFLLADQGYDVWMGNARGNYYSRKHVTLSPKDVRFWNFTWHEMGVYDLPAVIDHILKVTEQPQLFYIGHSMGATMFFVLTSTRPEYNQKIRLMVALAPVVFNRGILSRNIPAKLGIPFSEIIYRGVKNARQEEVLPRLKIVGTLLDELCRDGRKTQGLCRLGYHVFYGNDEGLLNKTMLPEFLYKVQSGMSLNTLFHYAQIILLGRFQPFDRSGKLGRILPEYNLTQVTAPISLHYAVNDIWSAREGIIPLSKRVQNVVKIVRLPDNRANHNSFGFSINARGFIYEEILNLLAAH